MTWDGIKSMALFLTTMNSQFMVERDSVVMEGFKVEDPVIHFFTMYGIISDGHWWNLNCSRNQTNLKISNTNRTFWKLNDISSSVMIDI